MDCLSCCFLWWRLSREKSGSVGMIVVCVVILREVGKCRDDGRRGGDPAYSDRRLVPWCQQRLLFYNPFKSETESKVGLGWIFGG